MVVTFSLLIFPAPVYPQASWPTSWIQIDWDKNENGLTDDWRDVEYAYYQYNSDYLFLKFECYGMPGSEWPDTDGRYKWFIDLEGDLSYSGGSIYDSEYLLFVEDSDDDGSGEQFLLFDANNDGNYGEYEPWPPANYANYMITDPSVGSFRVAVNQIEMYINWTAIGDPSAYWLAWATDQENPNLDQGPTTDRWDEEEPLMIHDVAAVNQTASPTVVTQGEVVSIDVLVENQGTQSETFNVTCYFDTGIVGTQLVANLPAGNSTTLNFLWDTTGVAPSNYVVKAWADSGGTISETDEVDNWCTAPAIVTVKIHDVAAISQVPNVTQVARGEMVSIDVTVKNQGNFTETFDLTCYYDSNPIGTQLASNLVPGASTVKTFYWDTTGVALDTYYIRAWADSGNVILETDEANNNCTSFVTVTVYEPAEPGALFVDKAQTAVISGYDPPVVGFTTVYELTILVTNPGGSTVTNVVVNDTISSDVIFISVGTPSQGSITATPPPKIIWSVGSLNAGASATLTFRASVTPTAPGLLYLNHKEDLTASGIDSYTGNPVSDTGDTDITVEAIARDVAAISQVPSSTVVLQGDSVAIYVTVENQGTQSETFNVTCYYNDGLTDVFIGRLRVYSLSASDNITLTFGWNTIGVAPGVYTIKAWADSGMEIDEGDETDNWCTAPAAVEIVIHDVAVLSQTPNTTTVTQGGSVTIDVVVENQGSKPETFQVTCSYNSNPIGSPQTVTNLAANTSTTVIFLWDTTGVPPGTYYIYAAASTVPGEKDTDDNTCKSVEVVTVLKLQHLVGFSQTGLDSTAIGVIVTVNGSGKFFGELPFSLLVDNGTTVSYSYTSIVPSSVSGMRFRLDDVTGPASPITVLSAMTVTGNYVKQYSVTFNQTGLDSSAIGTVVTVNAEGKTFGDLPYILWLDSGSAVTYSYSSPVSSATSGKKFVLTDVTGSASPITVTSTVTVTGNYKTRFYLTVTTNPTGLSPAPTPSSNWYDAGTNVVETAPSKSYDNSVEYDFNYWDVDGSSQGNGVNPITVTMNKPHIATAHYQGPPLPPECVGGEIILFKADRPPFVQGRLELMGLFLAATVASIVLIIRKKRRQ